VYSTISSIAARDYSPRRCKVGTRQPAQLERAAQRELARAPLEPARLRHEQVAGIARRHPMHCGGAHAPRLALARLRALPTSMSSSKRFSVLRDPSLFAQARVIGGVVTWPGGLDIAPDAMYDEIREHGTWTITPFRPDSTTR